MQSSDFKEIYDGIICPEAVKILENNPGLYLIDNAYEVLQKEYSILYEYFTSKYMSTNSEGPDVHKEIAIIIISMLKAKVIKTLSSDYYKSTTLKFAFNEILAFSTGLGILSTAIIEDYKNNAKISQEEKDFSVNRIEKDGLLFPHTSYQSYYENVITEFYNTSREGCYNFLSMADKFFWIEYFNKRKIKQSFITKSTEK